MTSNDAGSQATPEASRPDASPPGRLAIIVNPIKIDDLDGVRALAADASAAAGWREPLWYETTPQDPGTGQARAALSDGASVVCPLGGDGTVRAVAEAMVDTGVPMGLLPGGTGNLLARNLGLPVDSLADALDVALTGTDRAIDVGRVSWHSGDEGGHERVFLVMAGMGADAEIMAGANESLKNRVGWPAYLLSGAKQIWSPGFRVTVTVGQQRAHTQHARTVLVGNCGKLQGGLEIIPDAVADDGILDTLVIAPRGIASWAATVTDIVSRHHRGHPRLRRMRGGQVEVRCASAVPAEVDGEPMGEYQGMSVSIAPGALLVRHA